MVMILAFTFAKKFRRICFPSGAGPKGLSNGKGFQGQLGRGYGKGKNAGVNTSS